MDNEIAKCCGVARPAWLKNLSELPISEPEAVTAFAELRDRLHAEIAAHSTRIEITGIVPVEIELDENATPQHASTVPRELEGGLVLLQV